MDVGALTIKTVRDGPVCTLILCGDLDLLETGRFLEQAALAVDDLDRAAGFPTRPGCCSSTSPGYGR